MKEIFSSVIKKKVIVLINNIGLGVSEIIINLPLSFDTFDTIELEGNSIILHKFIDELDYPINFDDLDDEDKWKLDLTDCSCIEINYDESIAETKTDMKIFG